MCYYKDMVKDGERFMKETSQACMVVATLIATIVFAAVFTVPAGGNKSETGVPVYLSSALFMVFIVADGISFFSSCTSILMFLAILTSRHAEQDSLPRKF
ncbi:Ankyrin repeat family protein [Thalictrum thalictroides]|uniref:Ankyrin repeat family protein n=1 Tax=Thalictrum thalictroides TaxID=46969 RepID=A0A7J6WJ85_THATH|nr:Ankyrin repeat family protein [Thalictrum thalictroides]